MGRGRGGAPRAIHQPQALGVGKQIQHKQKQCLGHQSVPGRTGSDSGVIWRLGGSQAQVC